MGMGQTMEEAITSCKKAAEQITGYYVECNPESLDDAKTEWEKLKEFGVDLT